MKKYEVAKRIERFMKKYGLDYDVRIYFNNIAWDYDSSHNKTVMKDIKGSEYFEYANDDTISMSFEGQLFDALNMYDGYTLYEEFDDLDFDGHYFEMGNAWNLAFYPV